MKRDLFTMLIPFGLWLYSKAHNLRFRGLIFFASLLQILFGIHSVVRPRTRIGPDALLFLYSGQVLHRGGLPYRDVWDIKPPVIHETAALLAIFSGNDPFILFVLSIILTSTVFVIVISLVSDLVYNWTDNRYAAVTAGLFPLLFPKFTTFASLGLRPKLFVIAFGLLSLRFYSRERPFSSGVLAALSAGLWQFGVFFPIATLSHAVLFKRWQTSVQIVVAGLVTTIVVVSPFLLTDTFGVMLQQVVIASLLISEQVILVQRLLRGGRLLLFTAPIVVIGAGSALVSTFEDEYPWWVGAGLFWFAIQIWILDLDSTPDLFVGLIFVAFGVGIFVHKIDDSYRELFFVLLFLVFVLMWSYRFMTGTLFPPAEHPLRGSKLLYNYWHGVMPDDCHLRMSTLEQKYVKRFGRSCTISVL